MARQTMAAQESLLFILDGSGSMWGRVDNQPKIGIAKEVMTDLIEKAQPGFSMGLIAYGHRRKGDCQDIEQMTSMGSDKTELIEKVKAITARGKTPITKALENAGNLLKDREENTTIVLVSDGVETCEGDPCSMSAKLREQGHKVVIHTVGFDVNTAAENQLKCVAQAGGGQYFQVDNARGLYDALATVQASVAEKKPLPEPPKVEKAPENKPVRSKRIRIAGPGKVQLEPDTWVKPPKYWKLVEAESGEERSRSFEMQTKVKQGEYQLVWRQAEHGFKEVPLSEVVTVESGKTVKVPIDTGLRITSPKGIPAPRWWGLAEPGRKKPLFSFSSTLEPQVVPAGTYELLWRQDEHGARTTNLGPVTIESGKLNDIVVDSGVYVQPADWMPKKRPYYYRLLDEKKTIRGSWSLKGPQLAAPGVYTLIYRPTEHGHNNIIWGKVTVKSNGITTIPLDSGAIFLHEKGAKAPYRIFFINLDTSEKVVVKQNWDAVPLPPGRYKVDWWQVEHGTKRQTLMDELRVEPGTVLELEL